MKIKPTIIALLIIIPAQWVQAQFIYQTDFTEPSTYKKGQIDGQDGWASEKGMVIRKGVGAEYTGYKMAVNSALSPQSRIVDGETYTAEVTFSYEDLSGGKGSGPHVGVTIYNAPSIKAECLTLLIRRQDNAYRLMLSGDWGKKSPTIDGVADTFSQSQTYTCESIGIVHGNDTSTDLLTLSISLTAGKDSNSWSMEGKLFNQTTQNEVKTYTLSNITFNAPENSNLFGGFGGGHGDKNQNIQNRLIKTFSFSSTVSQAAPEPTTLAYSY